MQADSIYKNRPEHFFFVQKKNQKYLIWRSYDLLIPQAIDN
jgi:hypothetical protein